MDHKTDVQYAWTQSLVKLFLDQCFHRFCYHCIFQWSEMMLAASLAKSGNPKRIAPLECPLCKTHYSSIIHDLVSGAKFQREFLVGGDGSQFKLSEAHRRRLEVYAGYKGCEGLVTDLGLGVGGVSQGFKTRTAGGVVKSNKWLMNWVRRELEAVMHDEDVKLVTYHVVGVVESLQKQGQGKQRKEANQKNWVDAVAAAVRPFVFEDAEIFAVELWKFLDAGIDIAFYEQQSVDSGLGADSGGNEGQGTAAPAERARLTLFDEDVEEG